MNLSHSSNNRILLCAYGFPPLGGPTERRWFNFVKYLSQKGWLIDILTVNPSPNYHNYDAESLKNIPEGVRIFRTYPGPIHKINYQYFPLPKIPVSKEKSKITVKQILRNFLKKTYRNLIYPLLIPDETIEWVPFAFRMAKKLLNENDYKLVISSAYPFSSHIVGLLIKNRSQKIWIGDWSDPLAFNPALSLSEQRRYLYKRIEIKLLKKMDKIILPTEEMKIAYLKWYPFLSEKKLEVISYGVSLEDYEALTPIAATKFRIVYTGIFYKNIRNPYNFFNALIELKDKNPSIREDIEVIIAGSIPAEYIEYVHKNRIDDIISFLGHKPHNYIRVLQKSASVLLLLGSAGGLQLPGKIFEYIAAQNPILCIQYDKEDIAAKLVKKLNCGIVIDNEIDQIREAILTLYKYWKEGSLLSRFNLSSAKEFDWKNLSSKLEKILLQFC